MIVDIVMPKMGESITEGTIIEWRKKVGDAIKMDEIILEIGTDKVDSEIPSSTDGVLIEIIGKPNDVMEVGAVIARVETDSKASVIEKPVEEKEEIVVEKNIESKPVVQKKVSIKSSSTEKKFFTPVVNRIAEENNIDHGELMNIKGSGKGGRVTKVDILSYIKNRQDSSLEVMSKDQQDIPSHAFSNEEDKIEMDHMRKLIADHMRSSIDTSAHVYVMTEVDMTKIVDYVSLKQESFFQREGYSLTYTPFIIQACVKALGQFPDMNSSLDEKLIIHHKNINIGMAVAVDNGLMVPVILNCEELNFLGICRKVRDLVLRTRNKELNADELQGSTFSISNFGVFNVTMGTPIINQPNVGILGVGVVKKRPVVIETNDGDTIGIKSMMYLSLGFDHRLIDGAGGSQFIESIRENIEKIDLESLL